VPDPNPVPDPNSVPDPKSVPDPNPVPDPKLGSGTETDFVVVGAGPAGIAAACIAAEHGLRVAVFDQGELPGGQIWRGASPTAPGAAWRERFAKSGAAYFSGASVVDLATGSDTVSLTVERANGATVASARSVLLATGARELLLPFPGWTLPGVMGAGGAQALLKSGLNVAGKRVVVAGTGPLILAVAAAMRDAGADVLRVLEQASLANVIRFSTGLWRSPATLAQAIALGPRIHPARFRAGAWVVAAHGADSLQAVTIHEGGADRRLDCDMLCVGMGLVPSTELARLAGCDVRAGFGGVRTDAEQRTSVPNIFAAGESAGVGGMMPAVAQGIIVGLTVAGQDVPKNLRKRRDTLHSIAARMHAAFALRDELRHLARPDTLVCRCEDVPLGDVSACDSIRAAKLYTRCGMGPCQGRICGASLQFLLGWESDTIRQPVQPARVSTVISS